jgi:hypothetical protein
MPFDKSRSYDVATPMQYSGAVEYGGSKRPWWVPLFWFIVIAVIAAAVLGSMGCASAAPVAPTVAAPTFGPPLQQHEVGESLRRPSVIIASNRFQQTVLNPSPGIASVTTIIVGKVRTVEPGQQPETCDRMIVVNPETMAGGPGIWFNVYPLGLPPEGGCDTGHPTGYAKWSITPPATRFLVYHRPFDASQGWNDPERFGNWANITNPVSGGVYTVSTYNGGGSTTTVVVTAK